MPRGVYKTPTQVMKEENKKLKAEVKDLKEGLQSAFKERTESYEKANRAELELRTLRNRDQSKQKLHIFQNAEAKVAESTAAAWKDRFKSGVKEVFERGNVRAALDPEYAVARDAIYAFVDLTPAFLASAVHTNPELNEYKLWGVFLELGAHVSPVEMRKVEVEIKRSLPNRTPPAVSEKYRETLGEIFYGMVHFRKSREGMLP